MGDLIEILQLICLLEKPGIIPTKQVEVISAKLFETLRNTLKQDAYATLLNMVNLVDLPNRHLDLIEEVLNPE